MRKSTFTPEYELFVRLLIEEREAAGLNQTELAKRLGTYRHFVSSYEHGQRRLDIIQVIRICDAIGIEPSEFVARLVSDLRSAATPNEPPSH